MKCRIPCWHLIASAVGCAFWKPYDWWNETSFHLAFVHHVVIVPVLKKKCFGFLLTEQKLIYYSFYFYSKSVLKNYPFNCLEITLFYYSLQRKNHYKCFEQKTKTFKSTETLWSFVQLVLVQYIFNITFAVLSSICSLSGTSSKLVWRRK